MSVMANNAPPGFLGGGPQFNKVGNHPSAAEEAPIVKKAGLQPYQLRAIITLLVVVVLAVGIFAISAAFDSNHKHSKHGEISPNAKPDLDVDHPTAQ